MLLLGLQEEQAAPRPGRRPRPRLAAGPSPPDLQAQRCARPPLTSGSRRSGAITQPSRAARAREDAPLLTPDPEVSRLAGPEVSGRVEF